jgi:hypothetical protein
MDPDIASIIRGSVMLIIVVVPLIVVALTTKLWK